MSLAYWLNTGWMLASAPSAWAFHGATGDVAGTQAALLRAMLRDNRESEFGRQHSFASIRDARSFQTGVPLAVYEDFSNAVQRIAAGEPNVLTREPVKLLEPTSGSTGGEKLIPYTAGLQRQFQRAIAPCIANLLRHRPGLRDGRAYWSISPALRAGRVTSGGIPIGFEDDTAYLGLFERFAVSHVLAAPGTLARLHDLDVFRHRTLVHLMRARDLTLISIWNPTFLTALLRLMERSLERIVHEIRTGIENVAPDVRRADAIERIWLGGGTLADRLGATWPKLQLISCWTDAAAAGYVPELRMMFPDVEIQPKGLIATEAFVSLPLCDQPGAALAIRSHFFEFEEIGTNRIRLAHEVERGGRYRVIVTTAGGLYRYQLRDEVEIVGFVRQCPLVRFLGKADLVGDLVGEKLAEPFVRAALDELWRCRAQVPTFFLLVPVRTDPPRYRLYVQGIVGEIDLPGDVQAALEANPHYRYACGLCQLGPVEVHVLDAHVDGWRLFEQACLARGQKLGSIKPVAMDTRPGWEQVFDRTLAQVKRDA